MRAFWKRLRVRGKLRLEDGLDALQRRKECGRFHESQAGNLLDGVKVARRRHVCGPKAQVIADHIKRDADSRVGARKIS